ncbi:thioredoxin-like [Leucoraja erinacea]|uniref:thioredoxin-like n=1 Tax=Leucoraja erinaceus TaxID=7782 RepID=UPI0024589BAF|nr:thioredoxin-like [Leucoraja erinacea]
MAGAGSTLGKPKKGQGKSAEKIATQKGPAGTAGTASSTVAAAASRSPDAGTSRGKAGKAPPPPKAESLPATKSDEAAKAPKAAEKTAPEPVAKAGEGVPLRKISSKTQLDKFIKDAGEKLVVIFFSGTWCETCQSLKPYMREMAQVNTNVVFFCEVNVDDSEDTAEACDIVHIPTFQFYKQGKKIAEVQDDNKASVEDKIKELK